MNVSLQSNINIQDLKLTKILEHQNNLNHNNQNLEKSDSLYDISQKIKNLKPKNRLDSVEGKQSNLYIYAMVITCTLITFYLTYTTIKYFKVEIKFLNCFRMKPDTKNNIPMTEETKTNDP